MSGAAVRVREGLASDHAATIAEVVGAGALVADASSASAATDPVALRERLETALHRRGLHEDLLAMLPDAARILGTAIRGDPVPAAPYLVVASRGPVCRATLATGDRLVVELRLFEVTPDRSGYAFRNPEPGDVLRVTLDRD